MCTVNGRLWPANSAGGWNLGPEPGLHLHDAEFSRFVIGPGAAVRPLANDRPPRMTANNPVEDAMAVSPSVLLRRPQHKGLLFAPRIQETALIEGEPSLHRPVAEKPVETLDARVLKIALIGSYAPRKCGIATFTEDVERALGPYAGEGAKVRSAEVQIWPVRSASEISQGLDVRSMVEGNAQSFRDAGHAISASGADIALLQHEFGLFGGAAGDAVLSLVDALAIPLITTLHTVLERPDADQRRVMDRLAAKSVRLIVMTSHSRALLQRVYGVDPRRIALIEHGVPDRPFGRSAYYKKQLALCGPVLLTFGLLSPGKGVETAIAALPAIAARHPDIVYCIAGATHPNLLAREGESYRQSLQALARQLGVERHIRWIDRFLDLNELLDLIDAADIYITPYPGANQSTSGTLSYAVALGKAVISTPYVHAVDLLADGTGILVPFGDRSAISVAVGELLDSPERLAEMQARAYRRARSMTWENYAANCMDLFAAAAAKPPRVAAAGRDMALPPDAFFEMCDDTGIFQHGRFAIPDRNHGYCIDDNARALMLVNRMTMEPGQYFRLASRFAAFINHAWNEATGNYRNFMDYGRTWLEESGSPDSNGRTLWALGLTAGQSGDPRIAHWAADMFERSFTVTEQLQSPRAIAFAMLGCAAYLSANPCHEASRDFLRSSIDRIGDLYSKHSSEEWQWFEPGLFYDNARLCEAMLRAGDMLGDDRALKIGAETLQWLCARQTTRTGHFRPVGSDGFHLYRQPPLPFDQQPLEAWATIDACAAAFAIDGNRNWIATARTAYAWFDGANDRGLALGNRETGGCYDGLTALGRNLNSGAESILAYQLAHISLRKLDAEGGAT